MTAQPISTPNPISTPGVQVTPEALSGIRVTMVLSITVLLALMAYYFIGVDEGMSSVFGHSLVVHEWVHDSRHLLGFPCH